MNKQQIQQLLISSDREARRLGQKYCHYYRYDYYISVLPHAVRVLPHAVRNTSGRIIIRCVNKMSLEEIPQEDIIQVSLKGGGSIRYDPIVRNGKKLTLHKVYKIKLCKKN